MREMTATECNVKHVGVLKKRTMWNPAKYATKTFVLTVDTMIYARIGGTHAEVALK